MEQAHNHMNSLIQSAETLVFRLSANESVQYLSAQNTVDQDSTGNVDTLCSLLRSHQSTSGYIDSIYVYLKKSDTIITDNGASRFSFFSDIGWMNGYSGQKPYRMTYLARNKNDKYPYLLTIVYPILLDQKTNVGATVINIDLEKLGDFIGSGQYQNTGNRPILILLDKDSDTLMYSDEYQMYRQNVDFSQLPQTDTDYSTQICQLWNGNWIVSSVEKEREVFRYYYLTSMDSFITRTRNMEHLLTGVILLVTLGCLVLSAVLALWVYKPVRRTITILEENGMLTQWDKDSQFSEMEAIQRSVLAAKTTQDTLNTTVQERMILLHNAQVYALQTQVNPHFLYNTLEAIGTAAALKLNESKNPISDAIYTLGMLMRSSLSGETFLVTVSEELEHVSLYVKLMDFRFQGRIGFEINIPEEMRFDRILRMTLQPLIENAIEHGFSATHRHGHIWITGEKSEGMNHIHVLDDGQGLSQAQLDSIRNELRQNALQVSKHIGLRNVHQRLQLVFGENAGLSVENRPEGGLKVTVSYTSLVR